jgi:hypothetical protein
MKILDQKGDQENDGLVEYLRIWETSQLKMPTEEVKTTICLSLNSVKAIEEEEEDRVFLFCY